MRLAYVCADAGVPVFGRKGCSVHVQEVIRAFVRLGASVDLFASRVDGETPDGLEGVHVHPLPRSGAKDAASRERSSLGANRVLRHALESRGPFELVYERYSLWSYAGMQHARAAAIPGLLEVNAPLIDEQAQHRSLIHRTAAERVARRAFDAATAVIAVSEEVATRIAPRAGDRATVHVVPNGVNVCRFRPDVAPSWSAGPGTFTVGFVGTLKPWHGLSMLVRAFEILARRHGDVRLLIVGDGPGLADLRIDLRARGLLDVSQATGAVEPSTVPALLSSMTVAVAPYEADAGFYFSPLKVFEYMAAGLPVVASRVGQLAGIIDDGITGLLCSPGEPRDLADALERLHHDPMLRARLGRAARERAVREHGWDSVCERLLRIAGLQPPVVVEEVLA